MSDATHSATLTPIPRNQVTRFMFNEHAVRGLAVQLDDTWQNIHQAYNYPTEIRRLLGEATAATSLLTANIKFSGVLKLQIRGDAPDMPVQWLLAQCRDDLQVRGLAQWRDFAADQDTTKLDLTGCQIALTLQNDDTGQNYQGLIDASSGDLGQGLQDYYEHSEQLPTRLWLHVSEQHACGFMLQQMPTADLSRDEWDEDAWQRLTLLADTLKADELFELPIENILQRLFHEEDVQIMAQREVTKLCPCIDEQRIDNMLRGLGQQELEETLDQEGSVKVNCEFCNTDFSYDAIDVQQLFADNSAPGSNQTQ